MDTKARLINLEAVLKNNSIFPVWEKDNRMLIKAQPGGFDIAVEYTDSDVFIWFDTVSISIDPKHFDGLIYYFKLAFDGKLRLKKTLRKENESCIELLSKEGDDWSQELLFDNKDYRFWIRKTTLVLENKYRIDTAEIEKI